MNLLTMIGLPLFAYLLGSIPFGLVLTRMFTTVDIRSAGSGNIGATNVGRTAGKTLGLLTLFCDLLKGLLPVWLATTATNLGGASLELYVSTVALLSFLGHLYPIFMTFKNGGKGVATAAGCLGAISPVAFLVSILIFTLFTCLTHRVSVGSLSASALFPLAVWKSTDSLIFVIVSAIIALLIFVRHKDNIIRIVKGEEPMVQFGNRDPI
jgi:acyl phosphate:glycerol-3-phosphate acyltransferase